MNELNMVVNATFPSFPRRGGAQRRGGYKRCEATFWMLRSLRFSMRCASRAFIRWLRIISNHPVRFADIPSLKRRGMSAKRPSSQLYRKPRLSPHSHKPCTCRERFDQPFAFTGPFHPSLGFFLREREQFTIEHQVRDSEFRHTRLPRTRHFARATQLKIDLRQPEPSVVETMA